MNKLLGKKTRKIFTNAYLRGLCGGCKFHMHIFSKSRLGFIDGNGMEEDIWVDLHNPSNTQDCDSASDCNLLLETLGGAKVQTTYWTEMDFKDMKSKVKDDECVYFSETSKSDLKSADCSKDSKYPLCGHDCGESRVECPKLYATLNKLICFRRRWWMDHLVKRERGLLRHLRNRRQD